MRLRIIVSILGLIALIVGGVLLFTSGSNSGTVGAGGLPLIKADVNPAKLPPEEPGGEIMPNADSTVFSAMSAGAENDPSMKNVKAPEPEAAPAPEDGSFAGLRTGFALPKEPEKKTESLFDAPESRYYSGGALKSVEGAEEKPQAKAEEKAPATVVDEAAEELPVEEPKAAEEKPATKEKLEYATTEEAAPVAEEHTEAAPVTVTTDNGNAAQSMEAQEMGFVRPVSKPPVPQKEVVEVAKVEAVDAAPKTEEKPAVPVAKPKETAASKPEKVSGKYYIQVASTPGNGDASGVWGKLQGKYPAALDGLKPSYVPVTVAGKGDYVRIQAGPLSESQARERCTKLRSVDPTGGCLVLRR